jgi:uncharacterized protein DUF6152
MIRIANRSGSRTVRTLVTAAFSALLVAFSAPAWVHHSGAMFDGEKVITITGTVTEFSWTNPHASFRVDVPNADGKLESWAIEMNSPNNLVHEGWKRSSIKAGDKVTVKINPLRDGRPGGRYIGITLSDGKYLGSDTEPAKAGAKPGNTY